MRKYYLTLLSICFAILLHAQLQEENFNAAAMPSGWTATTTPSNCEWVFGYTGNVPGSGVKKPASCPSGAALFNDNYNAADPTSCQDNGYSVSLMGPEIDLVSNNTTSAAIEIIYNHQAFGYDGNFKVEVWDGTAWQNILTETTDVPPRNTGQNKTRLIDVSNYINSAFKVKFIYEDENTLSYGVAIDNYKLINTATADIPELRGTHFNFHPNPVTDGILNLKAKEKITSVSVFNLVGQQLIYQRPSKLKTEINLSHLADGVYLVQVEIGDKKGTFKVLK
ncbi:MAG: hypothetical protein CSA39_04515 [Flavobacteriales bacterium]|nr:MAG: hypothetical protein CSA39_04515 [Flavobacteriales bacterium]